MSSDFPPLKPIVLETLVLVIEISSLDSHVPAAEPCQASSSFRAMSATAS